MKGERFRKPVALSRSDVERVRSGDFAVAVKWDGLLVSVTKIDGLLVVRSGSEVVMRMRPGYWRPRLVVYGEYFERSGIVVTFDTNESAVFRTRYSTLLKTATTRLRPNKFIFSFDPFKACEILGRPSLGASDGYVFVDCASPITYKYKFPDKLTADLYVDETGTARCGATRQQCADNGLDGDLDYQSVPVTFAPRVRDASEYAGRIVECAWTGTEWRVVRERPDKTAEMKSSPVFCGANNWKTVKDIHAASADPITLDELFGFSLHGSAS